MLRKIAITGNIASGKSQVEKMLSERFPVYDTDIIAHEILDEIKYFYGYDVFTDYKIDRKKLGELVFKDSEIRKKLENIVHPKVRNKILEIFEKHRKDRYVFISVPLLFEAGFEDLFDKIIFIKVNEMLQLNRLMERNGFSKDEAMTRINSQMSQEEKIKKSDFVIENNSSLEDLKVNIFKVVEELR